MACVRSILKGKERAKAVPSGAGPGKMIHRAAARHPGGRGPLAGLPSWFPRATQLLATAAGTVGLLGAVAPENAGVEARRLREALARGLPLEPRWTYRSSDHVALQRRLDSAAEALAATAHPLLLLYAERAEELALEAGLASTAGTERFGGLAAQRFAPVDAEAAEEARTLAEAWAAEGDDDEEGETLVSDELAPGSLLQRMREEVGRRGLPFAVVVHSSLAALAATGERQILVAAGRPVRRIDVERTVMHEIEGHAVPRAHARQHIPLFQFGTAQGVDDQEGIALHLEERQGFHTRARRRELAGRHLAGLFMRGGASFHETVGALTTRWAYEGEHALRIAIRAFRGSRGDGPGLGRERVYLEALVRARRLLAVRPEAETVLRQGQIGLAALDRVAPFLRSTA